jgi:dolichyl-phosphate-mannose-protein mannosyltransferase
MSPLTHRLLPSNPRSRLLLALILAVGLANGVVGIDWGLPYQWHTDEKVTQALNVLHSPRWDPDYFINPHVHIYLVTAAFKVAYLIHPGHEVGNSLPEILPMLDRASPARRLQFLAMRLARGVSVVFGLCTVLTAFVLGRRHWDQSTGLLAAAFTAVTMGLVNLWHFATPESLLIFLMFAALGLFDAIIVRGTARDYAIAAACAGVACSTKYTAVLLAVPFLVAHIAGRGRLAVTGASQRRLLLAGGVAVAAFVVGTPLLIADWKQFWEFGVVYNWYTGAPTGSLAELRRSYVPYLGLLGGALGWPLFVASLVALAASLGALVRRTGWTPASRGALLHAAWVVSFYAFYGLSPHHALRFIVPIAPSLVLLTAAAAIDLVRRCRTVASRGLVRGLIAAVLIYSAAYTVRADYMFRHDTRYPAGAWLNETMPGRYDRLDYFAIEAYLPYFDRPAFGLRAVPFIEQVTLHGAAFWDRAHGYLRESTAPIADANFYYDRYLDNPRGFPERAEFYRYLLTGTDPSGFRPIARFTFANPWWLNPRPERVAPEVIVFAKTSEGKR